MSNSPPNNSLVQNAPLTENLLKLIIKAANQKYEDFTVEEFELNWTIKRLKQHLTDKYPQKPEYTSIRLIYSGKMLHDHWTLSECIRYVSFFLILNKINLLYTHMLIIYCVIEALKAHRTWTAMWFCIT